MLALTMEASPVILTCGQGCGSLSWPYKAPTSMTIVFPCLSPLPTLDSCGLGASARVWRAFTRKVRDCAFGLWDGMGEGEEDFYETHRVRCV